MSDNQMEQDLEIVAKMIPYITQLFDEELSFAVAQNGKYIHVVENDKLKIQAKVGRPLLEGGAGLEAYRTGKTIKKIVSNEVYGIPFISYAIPIKNIDKSIVGILLVAKSLKTRNQILDMATKLNDTIVRTDEILNAFFKSIESVLGDNLRVSSRTEDASENIVKMDRILKLIQHVGKQSNMLGLNATIEAARAAEHGRGFAIVANEITKLSKLSNQSTDEINGILKEVDSSFAMIKESVDDVRLALESQVRNFEDVIQMMQSIKTMVATLNQLSEKL
ncbi:methyl-accepting chemotaxis protein [Geosporobacter ferrireducens]|uniref:Methyl-accepting transducer domain-containing protein n=1 Tax=Geosporobacter ferrireducens TaxID=1424294 RepID=A0A1D8GFY9_9FIRM|nr:methyl-accepting chemotaxis protein [Geosporobacter ferrireducens]AOT69810.1 hypothetical protein Gferi_09600 [Geosporobacter ferrireducens]